MHIFKDTHYDFLRWRVHALVLSWVIILAGLAVLATRGVPKGVEFSGGTIVIAKFDQMPSIQQVRSGLDKSFPGGRHDRPDLRQRRDREVMIRRAAGWRRVRRKARVRRLMSLWER